MLVDKFINKISGRAIMKQEGDISTLVMSAIARCGFKPFINKYYDSSLVAFMQVTKGSHGAVFFDAANYQETSRLVFNKIISSNNPQKVPELRDYKQVVINANQLYEESSPEHLKHQSEKDLIQKIKIAADNLASLITATLFTEPVESDLVQIFYSALMDKQKVPTNFINMATKVCFESFAARMDRLLLEFETGANPYRWQWMFGSYHSVPTIEKISDLIHHAIKERGGRGKLRDSVEKIIKEQGQTKDEITKYRSKLSDKEQQLFDFVQLTMLIRDVRKEQVTKMVAVMTNSAREMFERVDINSAYADQVLLNELLSGKFKEEGFTEQLRRRKEQGTVIYLDEDGLEIDCGNIAETRQKLFAAIAGTSGIDQLSLKGNVAFPGKAKGKVRIVMSSDDFINFEKGEVLVASMTRPEYVPVMKKAVAIVTDEGGLTSHAAIVAREMKKPCIVGTKNATQLLKDGDLVEVDADEGRVVVLSNK